MRVLFYLKDHIITDLGVHSQKDQITTEQSGSFNNNKSRSTQLETKGSKSLDRERNNGEKSKDGVLFRLILHRISAFINKSEGCRR
ncbi:hypothetical protein TNCV_4142271 [Trichonephila clavipes]|nr:hypothetical protein TNCV_4142271 [Trichonephila clavipes]